MSRMHIQKEMFVPLRKEIVGQRKIGSCGNQRKEHGKSELRSGDALK